MNKDSWLREQAVVVSLVVGLVTQGAAIVWTVSMMMSDIENNKEKITTLTDRIGTVEKAVQAQAVSMARVDANIEAIRTAVERMANRGPRD